MSDAQREMEALKRRMRELEAQQAVDPGGGGSDSDEDIIEIVEEVASGPDYHGLDKQWRPLQDCLAGLVKAKYPHVKSKSQVYECSANHVKAWMKLDYTYAKMKEAVSKAEERVKAGKQDKHELNKYYWDLLSKQKSQGNIGQDVSASFLVDKSVEHFKKVLACGIKSPQYVASTPPAQGSTSTPARQISKPNIESPGAPFLAPRPSTSQDLSRPHKSQLPRKEEDELKDFLPTKLRKFITNEVKVANCSDLIIDALSSSEISAKDLLYMSTVDLRLYRNNQNLRKVINFCLGKVNTSSLDRQMTPKEVEDSLLAFCTDFHQKFPDYKTMVTSNHPVNEKFTDLLRQADPPSRLASPPRRLPSPPARYVTPPRRPVSPPRRPASPPRRLASPYRPVSPPRRPASPYRPASPPRSYRHQESRSSRPASPPRFKEEQSPARRSSSRRSPVPSGHPPFSTPPSHTEVENRRSASRNPTAASSPRIAGPCLDVDNFKASSKSVEHNLHRMTGHPFKKEQDMDAKHINDFTLVALDTVIVGAGLNKSEIVQIGAARSGASNPFFAPLVPSFRDEDRLGQLGFKRSSYNKFKFRHPQNREMIDCVSLPDAFKDLCSFLEKARAQMDGVVLIFLNRETLLTFLKTVSELSSIKKQLTSIVRGYVILEPIIRTNILGNMLERSETRLNIEDIGNLFRIRNPGESSDYISETLMKIAHMPEVRPHIAENMKKLRSIHIDEVVKVLENFEPLISHIAVQLSRTKNLSLKGIFDPFPQIQQKFLEDSDVISNKFVEILVFNDLSMDKLKDYDIRNGSDQLYKFIKEKILDNIGEQREKTINIIDECVDSTVRWLNIVNEVAKELESSKSRSRNLSGLSTPTYDSEGSMPEELPRPKSPFKSSEYSQLEEFLIKELPNTNKGKFTQETIKQVAWLMAKAWENVDYSWIVLSQRCMDPAVTLDKFEGDMSRRFKGKYDDKPKEWKGFSCSDLFEKTFQYFKKATSYKDKEFKALEKHYVEAISNVQGDSKDAVASPDVINIAKALTKTWETNGYSFRSLMAKITQSKESLLAEAQLKNALKNKYPLLPAEWVGYDYDFIIQECFTYFKKEDAKDELNERKRKWEGDAPPAMDARKRRRMMIEESWKKECVGIEDEMKGLQSYCDKIKKEEDKSWESSQSMDLILQMVKLLDRNKFSLREIQNTLRMRDETGKEIEMFRICRVNFDGGKKPFKKGSLQSDMVTYAELLKRFGSYITNSDLIKEDIAFKSEANSCTSLDNPEPVYVGPMTIDQIELILVELQKRYQKHARGIPKDYENLHLYLYYNASIKTVQASVPVHKIVWDLIQHLAPPQRHDRKTFGLTFKELAKKIGKLRDGKVSPKELNTEIGLIVKKEKLPESCLIKSGLLINSVVDFFNRRKESFPISSVARKIKMMEEATLPPKYQEHLFYCYVEEAIQMNATGELEGFEVTFIDTIKLSLAVHETVVFMIDSGFELYKAIKSYIEGNLIEWLKKLVKPHEDVNPEANHGILLTRLTHDFIESIVKKEQPALPIPRTHRNLLKRRVVNLISNGQFFQTDSLDKVKINLPVPKMERETLEPISDCVNNNDDAMAEIKQDSGDDFVPGSAVLFKVVVIPPLKQKKFFANCHGLPKIKKETMVRIKPVAESIQTHKVEMSSQTIDVQMDMTVLVSVQNKSQTEVVRLPRGLVIATAEVIDKSCILEEKITPGYCLQFIKHFNLHRDINQIFFEAEGDVIEFGEGNLKTTLEKDQRTNFKIFGIKYFCGRQDYYTVDAIVYFLLNVKSEEMKDYGIYLKLAIQNGKQIVRLKDAEDLYKYLHDKVGICPQIDKSFNSEKDLELATELVEMKMMDDDVLQLANIKLELNENPKNLEESKENDKNIDNKDKENNIENEDEENPNKKLILQLKEFLMDNYEMKLPQITEEISFFVELLEGCGYSLSKLRLDLYAIPNYREIFKEELNQKLRDKLNIDRFLIGGSGDFNRINKISMDSLHSLPVPSKVKDVRSFLEFAKKFSSEIPGIEGLADELTSYIRGKVQEDNFLMIGDDGKTEESCAAAQKRFEEIRRLIGSVTSLKPPTAEGNIEVYSAASTDSIAAVIVQEQTNPNDDDKKAWYPIAYNARLLTPEEEKMGKIEKEAHAVIWGIKFNKDTLFGMNFRLNVTSNQLGNMFKVGNVNTAIWVNQLLEFKFTVSLIKSSENPAMCLTKRNEQEERRPYARETLIPCLLDETIMLMKKNGKTRNRWIKFQMKRRKRAFAETIEKNVGMVENGNFDFEYQPKVSKFSGGPVPRGIPSSSVSAGSRKSTGSVQFGPTIDFIIATSTSENKTEPQDIGVDVVGPQSILPQCSMLIYQPLFEKFFTYLVGVKHMDRKVAKEKADKTFTLLTLSNVEYDELKQFVKKIVDANPDVEQKAVVEALNGFMKSKGVTKLFLKEEFLKQCVEHFYLILKIRPKIKVKLKKNKPVCKESEVIYDASMNDKSSASPEVSKETENEESGWFLDLLEKDVGHGQRERRNVINWSIVKNPPAPPKPQTIIETPKEPQTQEYKSFENLKGFYNKTIQSLSSEKEKKKYAGDNVTGSDFIKCWIIAEVMDCNHLNILYKANISHGRSAVVGKLENILNPFKNVLPLKGSYITNLISWTYKYLKSITNSGGSLHSLYQRTQIMRIQKEGHSEELFTKLENFYVSVMLYAHDRKQEEASQIAKDCIDWFQLCGFSYQSLKDLFTAAACISSCLDQLHNSLMHNFNNVSCLLPQTVDIVPLMKYTLVFFRAESVFADILSEDSPNTGDKLTTLYPLVTHANQVIMADMDSQKDVTMGQVIIKNELFLQPGDRESVEGRISWPGRPPTPGTPLRMVTHHFTKVAHKTVAVVEKSWHYGGMTVDVTIRNNSKSNAVRIGNPGRDVSVAEIMLGPPTSKMVGDQCEVSAEILARHGVDLNTLAKLYQAVVQGTEGCPKIVSKIALQHCFKTLSQGTDLNQGQKHLFDSFIKEALKYSSRVNVGTDEEEDKEKGDGKEGGMSMETVDIEDGEVLSDEEDEKDVKPRDKKVDRKEEVEEEEVGGMISFKETLYTDEELNQEPMKEVETVDLFSLLREHHSTIDFTPVSGHITVGKYLVPEKQSVDLGEVTYDIDTVVTFLNNSLQHHPDYVKKVSASHPHLPLVKMDHRKLLLSIISKDEEDCENCLEMKLELNVLTKISQIQRLYVKFKDLSRRQTEMIGLPSPKEMQFKPLFESYFTEIFYGGLVCQTNWYEVARVAAEELIHCWVTAQFNYSHLVKNMSVVLKERNSERKEEKYKRVFRYFYNELRQQEEKLPPALNLSQFVKKTIEMMETIEKVNKLKIEKDSGQVEQENYVDIDTEDESGIVQASRQSRESSILVSSGGEEEMEVKQEDADDEEDDGELLKSLKDLNEKTDLKNIADMEEDDLEKKREELKRQLTEDRNDDDDEGMITDEEDEEISSSSNLAVSPKALSSQLDMLTKYVSQCSKDADTNDQNRDEPMKNHDLDSSVQLISSIADEMRKDNEEEEEEECGLASEEEAENTPEEMGKDD